MKLNDPKILDMLCGRLFLGIEQNIRYKLLSISWGRSLAESTCVVERDNRTQPHSTSVRTIRVDEFLEQVIRPE